MPARGAFRAGSTQMTDPRRLDDWRRAARLRYRRLLRGIEQIVYRPFDHLALARARPPGDPDAVALVQLELLGDYILWRPYGRALVDHLHAAGRKLTLVCNAAWLDLARADFGDCSLLPLNRRRLLRDWRYRRHWLRALRGLGVAHSYLPTTPRDGPISDAIIHALGAPATGFDAVHDDRPSWDRRHARRLYERLVPERANAHQALRQRDFLAAVDPALPMPARAAITAGPTSDYVVIAPGASVAARRWPAARFAELIRRLRAHAPELRCVLTGSPGERALTAEIAALAGVPVELRAGELDLPALQRCIAGARLVIGNDSAAGHLAAACGVPSVIALGGGHYGRCYPYAAETAPTPALPATVSAPMDCFGCNWICRYPASRDDPAHPCIAAISVAAMWAAVERVLDARPPR